MNNKFNILIMEDDLAAAKIIGFNLKNKGYNVCLYENAEEALLYFQQNPVDLVLADYSLPGMSGEDFFMKAREWNPLTPVIFMTALQSVDKAVQLMEAGAFTYITKPLDMDRLLENVKRALDKVSVIFEDQQFQEEKKAILSKGDYVFDSEKMQQILRLVMRVSRVNSTVLITGESGTGKEVIAQTIHNCSPRKRNHLVCVNLAALPPTLIEAELFGAVKGAYSGAVGDRAGKFEIADNGTLFLDEIGELSPDIQVKLLRVIQDRQITRLGSNKPRTVDIRLITATNKNLAQLVKENKFREDLYYRLNVINIDLPPLKEHKKDIPLLVEKFIQRFNQTEKTCFKGITKDALDVLMKYSFPGNIRELQNIVERAMVMARGDALVTEDLPVFLLNREEIDSDILEGSRSLSLPERLSAIEKYILEKTLKKHHFHQSNAARALGISEARLRYKMRILEIKK